MESFVDGENEVEIMHTEDVAEPTLAMDDEIGEVRLSGKIVGKPKRRTDRDTGLPVGEFTMSLDSPFKDFGELAVEVRGERLVEWMMENYTEGSAVSAEGEPYVLSEPSQPPVLRCESTSIGITF